jgi:hypothetical protein
MGGICLWMSLSNWKSVDRAVTRQSSAAAEAEGRVGTHSMVKSKVQKALRGTLVPCDEISVNGT